MHGIVLVVSMIGGLTTLIIAVTKLITACMSIIGILNRHEKGLEQNWNLRPLLPENRSVFS
ncbi:hypothetical protein ACLJJ6_01330 [Pediococcus siamensis]|uniref:hypothetical protein n=1 Tax=Pediococcus siamensis TaxID=381829 RepID=UPI0039A01A80